MFRRKFHRGFRRRRRLPETFTVLDCRNCVNIAREAICNDPIIDVFPLISMATHKTVGDVTELVSPERKGLTVDAVKFQVEHHTMPFDWDQCTSLPPGPDVKALNFILTIWEALIVLPLAPGVTAPVPDYLPNLSNGLQQAGDIADRVLWKRLSTLAMFGPNPALIAPNPDSTQRYQGAGPVVAKSKVRLDDRHALFYVRNFVHNVFFPSPTSAPICTLDCDNVPDDKLIPVVMDAWFKIFYHGTQRS